MAAKHPGFKAVAARIARRQGVSQERASAELAAAGRRASPAAKKANPRLKRIAGALLFGFMLSGSSAWAQTQALKSFAYASSGCSGGFMYFGSNWQMGASWATPGAGAFPSGNFWVRAISLTYFGAGSDWAIVGHSGPNGDWVTPPALPGKTVSIVYPPDAAPLFISGEYFDVHSGCSSGAQALVSVWYVPAP